MERIEYRIKIAAPAKVVWETMLGEETYKQWAGKGWPNSSYQGQWKKGEKIRFTGPDGDGTLAEIVELKPNKTVLAKHIAILQKGGKEDSTSDFAKNWINSSERYDFNEANGNTTLLVTIETYPEWKQMFDEGWPKALDELKELSEHQLVSK